MKPYQFLIDDKLKELLRREAFKTRVSEAAIVRAALEQYLSPKSQKRKAG
jgi:predicted transcriptional regulator